MAFLVFLALQEVKKSLSNLTIIHKVKCFYLVNAQIVHSGFKYLYFLSNFSSGTGPPGPVGPPGPPGQPGSFSSSSEMRQYISDYLSKSFSEARSHTQLSGRQNRALTSFICSMQAEAVTLTSPDLQVHLGLQESLEPSPALWRTSPLGSSHTCNVSPCFSECILLKDNVRSVYV